VRIPRLPRVPPSTPQALGWSALWATFLDVALLVIALAWTIDAFAPPQDLPWKPLRLFDPPGLATGMKFAGAAQDRQACRRILAEGGVDFAEVPQRVDGTCAQLNAVRLRGGVTPLSPAAPVMTCPQALAYAFWDRHGLQPAARALAGARVARVDHVGTYACRNVYNRAEARRSEHAFANAIDVTGFRLSDGRIVRVVSDYRRETPDGRFLRRARQDACQWFRAVLGPDYNAAHRDHLHLDFGRHRVCR
jgi:hypothetical protein